jgi:hypothetical protein
MEKGVEKKTEKEEEGDSYVSLALPGRGMEGGIGGSVQIHEQNKTKQNSQGQTRT